MHPPQASQSQSQQQQQSQPPSQQQLPTTQHHHHNPQQQQQQQQPPQPHFHPQQQAPTAAQQHHSGQHHTQHHHHHPLPPTTQHHNSLQQQQLHQQHHHHPDASHPTHAPHHHAPHHPHIAHPHPGGPQHQHHVNQHQHPQQPQMHAPQRQPQQYLQPHIDQNHTHQQHAPPHHHHHHQQQPHHHPSQAQQHQIRAPQAHHHMTHGPAQSMLISPSQYAGMMYAPHFMPQAGPHMPPSFNHAPNLNYRTDHMTGVNSQSPTQQQPQQPPQQQAGSINPNNISQRVTQVPPSVVNTSTTSNTGVQQISNGPVLDPHMHTRLPINSTYLVQGQYPFSPIQMMGHYQMGNPYPGPHLPTHNPAMLPPRLPTDIGVRPQSTLEPHNHITPPPRAAPISSAAVAMAPKPTVPMSAGPVVAPISSAAPPIPIKPRVRKALAIVDPETKHVFTEDELKSFPSNSSSSSASASKPQSAVTTTPAADISSLPPATEVAAAIKAMTDTETPSVPTATTLKSSTVTSEALTNNVVKSPPVVASTIKITTPASLESSPLTTSSSSTSSTASTASPKSPTSLGLAATTTAATTVTTITTTTTTSTAQPSTIATANTSQPKTTKSQPVQPTKPSALVDDHEKVLDDMQKLSISESSIIISPALSNKKTDELSSKKSDAKESAAVTANHVAEVVVEKDVGDTVDHAKIDSEVKMTENNPDGEAKESDKKLNPDLPYEDGQYSPSNPQGRKKYSIKFLRAVGTAMGDTYSPLLMDRPMNDCFKPNFVNDYFYHNYRDAGPMSNRRGNQQIVNKPPRKIIPVQPTQLEVELKTVEKPWRPELETDKKAVEETGEMDTTRLLKVFRGHLNKLTPQKYDSIIEKVAALDLSDEERLKSVIDLVFDKAVDEPSFCELYARLCRMISQKNHRFNHLLVGKCQTEFETTDLYDGLNVEARTAAIESETDIAKKKMLEEELYEDMRIRRKKYLGTIKLIGEMYKLNLLIPKIIGFCMRHLMMEASNENLECLCSLITTVGAKMASEPEGEIKNALKHYLDVLHNIAYNKKSQIAFELESRIKFKILDTIELSKRNWRPRMVENNPKKLEEIREEAKQEEAMSHRHNHSKGMMKNEDRDRNRGRAGNLSSSYQRRA